MRSIFAFICAIVIAAPANAFSYSKGFKHGTVRCTSDSVRSVEPKQQRSFKTAKGERGSAIVDVVDLAGKAHKYTFSVATTDVASKKLGGVSKNLSLRAWDFVCSVQANKGVAHNCRNIQGTSGSCLACSVSNCSNVTFRVSRK